MCGGVLDLASGDVDESLDVCGRERALDLGGRERQRALEVGMTQVELRHAGLDPAAGDPDAVPIHPAPQPNRFLGDVGTAMGIHDQPCASVRKRAPVRFELQVAIGFVKRGRERCPADVQALELKVETRRGDLQIHRLAQVEREVDRAALRRVGREDLADPFDPRESVERRVQFPVDRQVFRLGVQMEVHRDRVVGAMLRVGPARDHPHRTFDADRSALVTARDPEQSELLRELEARFVDVRHAPARMVDHEREAQVALHVLFAVRLADVGHGQVAGGMHGDTGRDGGARLRAPRRPARGEARPDGHGPFAVGLQHGAQVGDRTLVVDQLLHLVGQPDPRQVQPRFGQPFLGASRAPADRQNRFQVLPARCDPRADVPCVALPQVVRIAAPEASDQVGGDVVDRTVVGTLQVGQSQDSVAQTQLKRGLRDHADARDVTPARGQVERSARREGRPGIGERARRQQVEAELQRLGRPDPFDGAVGRDAAGEPELPALARHAQASGEVVLVAVALEVRVDTAELDRFAVGPFGGEPEVLDPEVGQARGARHGVLLSAHRIDRFLERTGEVHVTVLDEQPFEHEAAARSPVDEQAHLFGGGVAAVRTERDVLDDQGAIEPRQPCLTDGEVVVGVAQRGSQLVLDEPREQTAGLEQQEDDESARNAPSTERHHRPDRLRGGTRSTTFFSSKSGQHSRWRIGHRVGTCPPCLLDMPFGADSRCSDALGSGSRGAFASAG